MPRAATAGSGAEEMAAMPLAGRWVAMPEADTGRAAAAACPAKPPMAVPVRVARRGFASSPNTARSETVAGKRTRGCEDAKEI